MAFLRHSKTRSKLMTVEHMIPSLRANKKPYRTLHEITAANLSPIPNPRDECDAKNLA